MLVLWLLQPCHVRLLKLLAKDYLINCSATNKKRQQKKTKKRGKNKTKNKTKMKKKKSSNLLSSFVLCVSQQADVDNSALGFRPSLPDLFDYFCLIIDTMVISARKLNRVENLLFETVEDMEVQYLSSVSVAEELVERAKERIHTIITANSHGPIKSVECCLFYVVVFLWETSIETVFDVVPILVWNMR